MHRTRIKFCGVCRPTDVHAAVAAGADAIGMILHAKSQRLIEAEDAMAVASAVPPLVSKVGVFVDARAPFVAECARTLKLDLVQLHGHETHDYVRALDRFRIVKVVQRDEWDAWREVCLPNLVALMLDSAVGGSGVANDWEAIERLLNDRPTALPVIFAGGLKPETVGDVVRRFSPFAVDVSSGVEETPGHKSAEQLSAFAQAVRAADAALP